MITELCEHAVENEVLSYELISELKHQYPDTDYELRTFLWLYVQLLIAYNLQLSRESDEMLSIDGLFEPFGQKGTKVLCDPHLENSLYWSVIHKRIETNSLLVAILAPRPLLYRGILYEGVGVSICSQGINGRYVVKDSRKVIYVAWMYEALLGCKDLYWNTGKGELFPLFLYIDKYI